MINSKRCLICKRHKQGNCLHWHIDQETGDMWCWCVGKCNRGYSLREYCHKAGIQLNEFLRGDFDFEEAKPNEVSKIEFPQWFVPMSDPRASKGVEYIYSRGLKLEADIYYDIEDEGIVFPYYYENTFCGAQVRFIVPRKKEDGSDWKMTTLPGTRTGLLFYGWNQMPFMSNVKGLIVCEGAFNAISIQQALNSVYGGFSTNPWRCISCSGSGSTKHHAETIKELKDNGLKVILAFDSDEAGIKGLKKFIDSQVLTHYVLSEDDELDWNDWLQRLGHEEFARYFLNRIKKI